MSGSFWATEVTRYRPTLYSLAGEELATLDRTGDFFPRSDVYRTPRDVRDPPPTPEIRALHLDSDGLLWVAYLIAGDEWQEAVRTRDPLRAPDRNMLYDTVVEVIDPDSAELLARTVVPWSLFKVSMMEASGQLMMSYVAEEGSGFPEATVLRFTLTR